MTAMTSRRSVLDRLIFRILLSATGVGGLGACVFGGTAQFSDQTAAAGLTAVHTVASGGQIEWMTGGLAAGDFNRDGWQDVFVLGGPGSPDHLYINNHDGTFTDRAHEWGVDRVHRGFGIAVGDYDNDGWLDIYITSGGTDGQHCHHLLYHNNGDGTFTNLAAQAGVESTANGGFDGFGVAFGDYDLDGYLDLAVTGYQYHSGGNRLFHNNGNGTFTDVSWMLGSTMNGVFGFSPRFADMNGDRYPEILWTADFGTSRYFINNGGASFTNATSTTGVGLDANGMGSAVGDFNGDGLPDWFVTSVYTPTSYPTTPGTGNMLYMRTGSGIFQERGLAAGVRQCGWAWGTAAVDVHNAGRQDIVVTNGWPDTYYGTQFLGDQSGVFRNNGDGTFSNVAPGCGVTHTGQGRGLIAFDYNNDGKQDILIATNGGPLTLYRNDTIGADANGLRILLRPRPSSGNAPDGYGAHVIVTTASGTQHRWITGGSSYLSQSELSAHFGLGSSTMATTVRVDWPNGQVTQRGTVLANQTIGISSCAADWNADGVLAISDIFDFLNAWFAGSGDFNAVNGLTVQDIFDFLNAWFAGCA